MKVMEEDIWYIIELVGDDRLILSIYPEAENLEEY